MRATLRYARIAPKKANLIAAMVRRQSVDAALALLARFPKKAARMLRELIASAAANAQQNAQQERRSLFVKSLTVQKGTAFRRSIPMARGRSRPIDKFTSHLSVELGVLLPQGGMKGAETKKAAETSSKDSSSLEHVGAPPVSTPPVHVPRGVGGAQKGFSPKTGPKGPTFQPHHRGGRGS